MTTGTGAGPGAGTGADRRDRPAFALTAAGAPVDPAVARDVVSIEVHEEIGRHGRCTVLLANWDPGRRTVTHSDTGPFTPGTELTIALGYRTDTVVVFDGVVAAATADFPAARPPLLRVAGRSRSILLEAPARSRQLSDVSDADIAAAIAADYSLHADAADGSRHAFWASDRIGDWRALTARAAQLGWVAYVRGKDLVMRPPAPNRQPIALQWTRTLLELHLTEDLTRAIDDAAATGWDVGSAEAVEGERAADVAGLDAGDRPDHAAAVRAAGWPLRSSRTASAAITAADEADARAVAAQRGAALAHWHGTGVTAGDPALRCDSWVDLSGVGRRLAGPHYVTAARHRLTPDSYTTEFQIGAAPALLPPDSGAGTGAGGRAGTGTGAAGAGLATGMVDGLDDPDGLNRIRVQLPWRHDGGEGIWARQSSLDAGDGYGAVVVPSKKQEVLVGFLDGDPAQPVVLGALYNGAAKPPVAVDADTNAERSLTTPDGHVLRLLDGEDGSVTLSTATGQSVVLSEKDSSIILSHHDSGNSIRLSADGIELTAAQGDITLSSPAGTFSVDAGKLLAKTTGPLSVESSATLGLKAAASLVVQGSPINLN